jgi:hypothetical protein
MLMRHYRTARSVEVFSTIQGADLILVLEALAGDPGAGGTCYWGRDAAYIGGRRSAQMAGTAEGRLWALTISVLDLIHHLCQGKSDF